jgi:hypothetical protein
VFVFISKVLRNRLHIISIYDFIISPLTSLMYFLQRNGETAIRCRDGKSLHVGFVVVGVTGTDMSSNTWVSSVSSTPPAFQTGVLLVCN